ncbi:hypothetical protein ON058_00875 [Demequina sp. B12]|uniref:hypothetical protein n=1 Tax=Demequina sp. B12 TaxID=2992757 RepID=UPI00237BDBCA|nr:hypothetical protein [Demequina sp. B12]MDE0571966.1 hypothetical protein [Demequina sp. B12]
MRTSVLAAITTALAVVIAGCTSPETSTTAPTPADPPFAQEVEQALQEAIDAQASAEQIADIEEIQATENVSYELTKAATQRTVDCVVDAGGEGRQFDRVDPRQLHPPRIRDWHRLTRPRGG